MKSSAEEDDSFRRSLAMHFHGLTRIARQEVFGENDEILRPINLHADSAVMFSGYVGRKYEFGEGSLLLGINPGGGGDSYNQRIPEDELFYPLLERFKNAPEESVSGAFEAVNDEFVPILRGWNLWRILEPTLDAAGLSIDEVAYMNIVPYRTRGDKMPPASARRFAWKHIVAPTLRVISPHAIIALGKKAGSVVDEQLKARRHTYCVPRTIGDTYISEPARTVLTQIRKERA